MEAISMSETPTQAPPRLRRWPAWISRSAGVLFVLLYFVVTPLCYCPLYYIGLSAIGLFPLVFGPLLYRCLGVAILVAGLSSADANRRGKLHEQQIQVQADAAAMRARAEQSRSDAQP
jgi:hypothetical protein